MKVIRPKAEIRTILSLLTSPYEVKVELLNGLSLDHFGYRPMNQAYAVVTAIISKSAMELPSAETFLEHPDLSVEAADILRAPTVNPLKKVDDAKHMIQILEHYRQIRRFYTFARESALNLKKSEKVDVEALLGEIEQTLSDMRSDNHDAPLYHVGRGAEEKADELMEEVFSSDMPRLIPSGFSGFDTKTGGFGANDLVVLASHAKGGKSIIALNMTANMYLSGDLDVCYIPLEMSKQETAERLISFLSGVEHNKIRTKTTSTLDLEAMHKAWRRFKRHGAKHDCRFTVWPTAALTTSSLKMRLKPFKYSVIVIDYINLMIDPTNNTQEWQKLGNFARELKLLTKDMNVLIVAPTQMNMDGEIRYAKAIKEHANTVWSWFYGEEQQGTHILTINQPAVRGWAPFSFHLREDFERMKVHDHQGVFGDVGGYSGSKMESMRGV